MTIIDEQHSNNHRQLITYSNHNEPWLVDVPPQDSQSVL